MVGLMLVMICSTRMRYLAQDTIFSLRLHLTIYVRQTLCIWSHMYTEPSRLHRCWPLSFETMRIAMSCDGSCGHLCILATNGLPSRKALWINGIHFIDRIDWRRLSSQAPHCTYWAVLTEQCQQTRRVAFVDVSCCTDQCLGLHILASRVH